jgi:sensor histidine kinase YesM
VNKHSSSLCVPVVQSNLQAKIYKKGNNKTKKNKGQKPQISSHTQDDMPRKLFIKFFFFFYYPLSRKGKGYIYIYIKPGVINTVVDDNFFFSFKGRKEGKEKGLKASPFLHAQLSIIRKK